MSRLDLAAVALGHRYYQLIAQADTRDDLAYHAAVMAAFTAFVDYCGGMRTAKFAINNHAACRLTKPNAPWHWGGLAPGTRCWCSGCTEPLD